jgi:hypothetical protein
MPTHVSPTWPWLALGRGDIAKCYSTVSRTCLHPRPYIEADLEGWSGLYKPRVLWNRVTRYVRVIVGWLVA